MVSSVAVRLGTVGKAEVKSDFSEIADSGDASAKRLVASYERAGDEIQKALDRRDAAAAKIAAAMPSSVQSTINASAGTSAYGGYRDAGGGGSSSQNATATQYAALLAQEEKQIEAVRAAIDPLYAAQKRYDAEIATADALLKRNAISETEHAAAVRLSAAALNTAKRNAEENAVAFGLNRSQIITAQSAVLRFTDAVLAGQNPLRAFALEAHKGVEVLSMDDDGLAGGLAKVKAFLTPTVVEIGATTAALAIGVAAWASYEDAIAKLGALAEGAGAVIGVTGEQLEANAEAASRSSTETVSGARDIESAYVRIGGIGADVLEPLTAATADFAAATGQDAKAAAEVLGKAMQDPVKGAEDLASRYGMLSQAQVEQIKKMEDMGDLYGAQIRLLKDIQPSFDGAAEHAHGLMAAFDGIKKAASDAFTAVGRFANDEGPGLIFTLTGIPLPGTFGDGKGPPPARTDARGKAFAEQAMDASDEFTGRRQLQALQAKQGDLKRALDDPGAVAGLKQAGVLDQTRQSLEAYTHAIDTFLPPAEKKRQLDLADVAIARARASRNAPALAAATSNRERIEQSGQVATKADVEADALAKGERARARLDGSAQKHIDTLAREAAAMDATTKGAIAAAVAYLQDGAAAGEEADARAKAISAATKSGADVDAQVRRQLAQSVAEGNEAGAKAISTLRLETSARGQVDDAVRNGTMTVDQMAQALGDEQTLRELTIKQSLAYRLGLTSDYQAITLTIEAYRKALGEAHAEEADSGSLKALNDIRNRIEDARLSKQFAGDTTGGYDRAKAALDARRAADADHVTNPDQRQARVVGAVDATVEASNASHAKYAQDAIRASNDNLAVTQAQVAAIGKTGDAQQLVLDKLKLQQQLAHDLGADYAEFAPAILAAAAASNAESLKLKQAQESMQELRSVGDKLVDDLFAPKGNGLKKALADAREELERMALINPLKNFLLGENNPTVMSLAGMSRGGGGSGGGSGISSLFGGIKKLLGLGGGGASAGIAGLSDFSAPLSIPDYDFSGSIVHFAAGTEYSSAGPAMVGENGPEILNLPQGSRVTNAADTRRMMANDNGGGRVTHNHFTGNLMTPEFWRQIQSGDDRAAARGAIGGSHMAEKSSQRRARRKLGTRG